MAKVAMSYKWCSEGIAYWFLTETEKICRSYRNLPPKSEYPPLPN